MGNVVKIDEEERRLGIVYEEYTRHPDLPENMESLHVISVDRGDLEIFLHVGFSRYEDLVNYLPMVMGEIIVVRSANRPELLDEAYAYDSGNLFPAVTTYTEGDLV